MRLRTCRVLVAGVVVIGFVTSSVGLGVANRAIETLSNYLDDQIASGRDLFRAS